MKVLHIITSLDDGGAESSLYRLCVKDYVSEHLVVSLKDKGKYGPLLIDAGVSVYSLNLPQGKVTFRGLLKLWRLIRFERPDAVQTWLYHADLIGGVVARLAGIRNVCWGVHHSNLAPGTMKRSTIFVARVCARVSKWVPRKIVSCSQEAARVHVGIGYSASRFVVVPNGYDLNEFKPDTVARENLRSEFMVDANKPLIGIVARFDPQKDHENLIRALGLLRRRGADFLCLLIGAGMVKGNKDLEELIVFENVGDCVKLLGQRRDVPALMNAMDLHVLSSLGEAFPNVLSESMACGTPCVTTDVGDAAFIVGDTGWVVPPRDSKALAEAIECALLALNNESAWSVRQGEARRRVSENFYIDRIVEQYRSVWSAVKG